MTFPEKLSQQQELFQLIVDASPAGMILVDSTGTILLANEAAERIFGYGKGELLQQSVERLVPEPHKSVHHQHRERFANHPEIRSLGTHSHLSGRRQDGTTFPADISLHPITLDKNNLVLANILDMTEQRRAEQQRRQHETIERLAMLGQLAGGVAHEIRTPLCVIRNDAYFLSTIQPTLGPTAMECVREIDAAVEKANRIVNELLDFTRDTRCARESVGLGTLLDRAIQAANLSPVIKIVPAEVSEDLHVEVDAGQIERVLVNLLCNAAQAMEHRGEIHLQVQSEKSHVLVEVADKGPGISVSPIEQVFDPLFTTKSSGIGLGLSLSRRYAEQNGGQLTACNQPGSGALFRLVLPRPASQTKETK